jgi:light-independent protochlorophyllide reductase subunit B
MFRDDFEFSDAAGASHLGHGAVPHPPVAASADIGSDPVADIAAAATGWSTEAEKELLKIPFFVRGKARRNTERYAAELGIAAITLETLYDAKAHHAR